jgi:hypothetical protein
VKAFVRVATGKRWVDLDLVFTTSLGSPLDAANVRRACRRVAAVAGMDAAEWTPRELLQGYSFSRSAPLDAATRPSQARLGLGVRANVSARSTAISPKVGR